MDDFKEVLAKHNPDALGHVAGSDVDTHRLLLVEDLAKELHLFKLDSAGRDLTRFDTVVLDAARPHERIGPEVELLAGKRVGIVGLGSLGSKIALSLARSGVTRFLLVDDDVFLPENTCRHTLDWRNVGEHKVVGVREQLKMISPTIKADVRRLRLAGQESTASVAGALQKLVACDLIVDATGDPATFNQLAMISRQYRRPLIWAEVYAGGIGGMVARHRPGKDADPFAVRAQYHRFTSEKTTAPPAPSSAPYAAIGETGEPLIATDDDVGVIAGHAASMVIDALIEREPSLFPYSMYLVGLACGWVFDQPFQVIPIDTGTSATTSASDLSPETVVRGVQFISEILEQGQNGSSSAS